MADDNIQDLVKTRDALVEQRIRLGKAIAEIDEKLARLVKDSGQTEPPKKAVKKTAKKKMVERRRMLSPAIRARIAEAARARWEKAKRGLKD